MADIDHFKRVNDTYGHETGDRALKTFSDVALNTLRHDDFMGRWGGEEFAFVLPGVSAEQATEVLDRIRLELAARLSTSDLPGFTVSYGVVDADACASLEAAVRLADNALYAAKDQGRDRAVIADTDESTDQPTAARTPRASDTPRHATVGVLASLARDDDPLER
jgi:diguanylate cyclase (GGDEF)-like protein